MTAVEYIEQSSVPEAMWPNLADWFGWFEKQGMVGIVRDEDGIAGVALARCVKDGQKPDHYVHSEDGEKSSAADLTTLLIPSLDKNNTSLFVKIADPEAWHPTLSLINLTVQPAAVVAVGSTVTR